MAAFFRAGILFALASLLAYLTITKQLQYFINPRLQYLIIFSFVALFLLSWIQLKHYRQHALHRIGAWGYVMVCLPLFFFLLFPSKPADSSLADQKVLTYVSPNQVKQTTNTKQTETEKTETEKILVDTDDWQKPYRQKAEELKKLPMIVLTSENYIEIADVMMLFPEQFTGKKIRTVGFVYREETFRETQFVIARLAVACCVADAGVIGFFVETPHAKGFQKEQWFQIEGEFELKKTAHGDVPSIKMTNYKKVPALKDSYVYQTFP